MPATQHRYHAGCAAAQAADGQGIDEPASTTDERTAFRKQAYDWLSADLTAWGRLFDDRASSTVGLDEVLKNWQTEPKLASVRDPPALATLTAEERLAWQRFWTDLAALRERAQKTKS